MVRLRSWLRAMYVVRNKKRDSFAGLFRTPIQAIVDYAYDLLFFRLGIWVPYYINPVVAFKLLGTYAYWLLPILTSLDPRPMVRVSRFSRKVPAPFVVRVTRFSSYRESARAIQSQDLCEALDEQGWFLDPHSPFEGPIFSMILVNRSMLGDAARIGFSAAMGLVVRRAHLVTQSLYAVVTTECPDDLNISWNGYNREEHLRLTLAEQIKRGPSTTVDNELFFLDAISNVSEFIGVIDPLVVPEVWRPRLYAHYDLLDGCEVAGLTNVLLPDADYALIEQLEAEDPETESDGQDDDSVWQQFDSVFESKGVSRYLDLSLLPITKAGTRSSEDKSARLL